MTRVTHRTRGQRLACSRPQGPRGPRQPGGGSPSPPRRLCRGEQWAGHSGLKPPRAQRESEGEPVQAEPRAGRSSGGRGRDARQAGGPEKHCGGRGGGRGADLGTEWVSGRPLGSWTLEKQAAHHLLPTDFKWYLDHTTASVPGLIFRLFLIRPPPCPSRGWHFPDCSGGPRKFLSPAELQSHCAKFLHSACLQPPPPPTTITKQAKTKASAQVSSFSWTNSEGISHHRTLTLPV